MNNDSTVTIERPPRKMRFGSVRECQGYCSHNNFCTLNPTIPHKLHICGNPDCPCHSRERYEPKS